MKRVNELFDVKEDFKIISLHSDSRYVGKDSVFFCIEGLTTDGHRYADDAVFQGAKVIVHSKPLKRKYPGVLYIQVKDVLDELNRVANIFYDYPSYKMTVIGITGTSGKTVVALTIRDVLNHYLKMGYIGTNDAQYGSTVIQSSYTTP
ncbi:MAG: Mur ligase domain-containing protein, partial [Intestinibaculum porci]